MDDSHIRHVEAIEFTDRHGKKRTRYNITYSRSEKTAAEMEILRLGKLSKQQTTVDPQYLELKEQTEAVIVTPYVLARTLAATRLREDPRPHKILTGADILRDYFDRDPGGGSRALQDGFTQYGQVYIFFGYIEAPNSYLPNLIAQLLGQRHHNAMHTWLFVPHPLADISVRWKNAAINDIGGYIQTIRIDHLCDVEDSIKGPVATTPVKQAEDPTLTADTSTDKKFARKKKKW